MGVLYKITCIFIKNMILNKASNLVSVVLIRTLIKLHNRNTSF